LAELPQKNTEFNLNAIESKTLPQPDFDATHLAQNVLMLCELLLKDKDVFESFVDEFGHRDLAFFAVQDLSNSLRLSSLELAAAAQRSLGKGEKSAWTIIAPNSHSLAAVHPIIMGFLAGLELALRIPAKFTSEKHFLTQLITGLNNLRPNAMMVLPASFHIESEKDIYKQGNILAFGTNQTLKDFHNIAPGRVSGFGETLAIACGDLGDVKKSANAIVRDFFSLRQGGCMSARVFILQEHTDSDLELATEALNDAASSYKSHLTVDEIENTADMPLVLGIKTKTLRSLEGVVAQKAYSIPVISMKNSDWNDFVKSLKTEFFTELPVSLILLADNPKNQEFLKVSTETPMTPLTFRIFGESQTPIFSGLHEGRPLFSINH
jgi:hypothetical protein